MKKIGYVIALALGALVWRASGQLALGVVVGGVHATGCSGFEVAGVLEGEDVGGEAVFLRVGGVGAGIQVAADVVKIGAAGEGVGVPVGGGVVPPE